MYYIVLDLEFNQSFEFEDGNKTILNPECRFEVIQIGAVKLNENLETISTANFLIKPQIYKRIHPYVEKITGFNIEDFQNKKTFPEVFEEFKNFSSSEDNEKIFCVWGNSDIKALYKNIAFYKIINSSVIMKYIDVQKLATSYLKYSKGGTIGLKNAVEALGLPTDEKFHNAYYDAVYTAEIFKIVKPPTVPIKIFNSNHI